MPNEIDPDEYQRRSTSPRWGSTTKVVVGLTFIAVVAALLIRFRQIIAPLFIAFVLSYLLYPLANFMHRRLKISWRLASVLLLLLLLIILLGLMTLGGVALFNQVQSLIIFIQKQIAQLPNFVETITSEPIVFGPFQIDLTTINASNLADQLLGLIQPVLTNMANILGTVAGGAFATVGWILFTILAAYFMLSDSEGARARLINLNIPGYGDDIARMSHELSNIWNAFLRNQIIIFFITVIVYIVLLGSMQLNYYFGLALLAGLARFVPYVGPWIAWITYGLVAYFQGSTIFGLTPFWYVVLVLGVAMSIDMMMDNFVVPRMMGDSLKIHPAAVLVAAIVFANLFGLLGVLLAAPVVATLKLISTYVIRKLFDLDPWEEFETSQVKPLPPLFLSIGAWFSKLGSWIKSNFDTKWPHGVPFIRWIQDKFHWVSNKFRKKSDKNAS